MKLDLSRYLAVLVAASFAAPVMAGDDDYYEPTSLTAPSASAQAEASPVSYNETTFLEDDSACTITPAAPAHECCRPLSCYLNTKPITNPYAGFNFSIDSTFMKPHLGAISAPGLGVGLVTPTYDWTFAPRYNLGYEGENGLGIRASYWSLAQGSNADAGVPGLAVITGRTQAETIDLDITQRIVFQKWNFLVGTGMRSVNTQNTLHIATGGGTLSIADSFDGWGPNFLLEANRPLGESKLSLYANGKGSLLFGQTAFDAPGLIPGGGQAIVSNDTVMSTYQIGMGLQWKGDMLFSKVGVEAQMWNQGQVAGLIGLDYGYVGPTSTIGIIF